MTTIKDIAQHLDISIGTVSKGLNNGKDVSEDLRRKILDAAVTLNYRPKRCKSKLDNSLCIFVKNMDYQTRDQFGYDIIHGFKQSALHNGFQVEVIDITKEQQTSEKYDQYMLRHGHKGGFFIGFTFDDPWLKALNQAYTSTVLLDNPEFHSSHAAYVGTDNMQAFGLAIKHLKEKGHHHIGFLNGHSTSKLSMLRSNAFLAMCKKYQLTASPSLIKYGDYSLNCAKDHAAYFIAQHVTAIICGSDTMALGMIKACQEFGFKVPDDISIIGFDDLSLAEHAIPPLTTIHQNRLALGKLAFSTLSNLLDGICISQTLLRPQLVVRHSTCNRISST